MSEPGLRYLVPQTDDETTRLRLQSKVIERPTQYVLDQVGLSAGMSVLDVGCGAGDLMRLMGARVGSRGNVSGIDLNGELGRRVVDELNTEGASKYEFTAGNFLEMPAPQRAPFDLVVSRLVFLHLPDSRAAARKLWSWTKPGGHLALMEHDFRLLDSVPSTEAAAILRQTIYAVLNRAGLDPSCGSKLPAILQEVTGGPADGVEVTTGLLSARDIAVFLPSTYVAYMDAADRIGIRDLPPRSAFFESLEGASKQDLRFFLPLLVSTWARKSAPTTR